MSDRIWPRINWLPSAHVRDAADALRSMAAPHGFVRKCDHKRCENGKRLVAAIKASVGAGRPFGFYHVKYDGTIRFVQPTSALVFHQDASSITYWCRQRQDWRSTSTGSIIAIMNHKGEQVVNLPECFQPA